MTDAEIIRALECCGGSEGCDLCPLKGKFLGCVAILLEHALALVNRQKERIKELEERCNRK